MKETSGRNQAGGARRKRGGTAAAGTKRVTLEDIARAAEVSSATVSRVLNKVTDSRISKATQARVHAVAKAMSYAPNHVARAFATGRTNLVGLWMTSLTEFYIEVMRGLDKLATRDGYGMMVREFAWGARPADVTRAVQWPMDGVVVVDPYPGMPLPVAAHASRRMPVVALGSQHWTDGDYVACDVAAGAAEALRHLLADRARRILFLTHAGVAAIDRRHEVYATAMRAAGLEPEYVVAPECSRQAARQALLDYARARDLPDGILCFNDVLGIGAHRALHEIGKKMPHDVALVGCDDIEEAGFLSPPLSTIAYPVADLCATAWQFLRKRMARHDLPPQQVTLPSRLVIRGTSGTSIHTARRPRLDDRAERSRM